MLSIQTGGRQNLRQAVHVRAVRRERGGTAPVLCSSIAAPHKSYIRSRLIDQGYRGELEGVVAKIFASEHLK